MKLEIKQRWSGRVIFEGEADNILDLLKLAITQGIVLRDADLSDADLRGADLSDAVLRGAVLSDADLRGAVLRGADLSDADLSGADLSGAVLRGAVLRGAVLRDAVLRGAVLSDADLSGADLSDAVLRGAVLRGAVLRGAVLSGIRGLPPIPIIQNLDYQILAAIEGDGGGNLEMGSWHTCETTHCRAGWAIHLAGAAGYELERAVGSCAAGVLIYQESAGYVPNFYAGNDEAFADIKARAAGAASEPTEVAQP